MRRIGFLLVATLACVTAPTAIAQEWVVNSGFTTGASYTDNYFLTTTGKQSGTTLTIAPFVNAARNTESSSVNAFLGVGANKVFGVTPSTEYLSGRLGLNGTLTEERSTYGAFFNASRNSTLQSQPLSSGVGLARTYQDALLTGATYSYALSERWTAGANASWYANNYQAVQPGLDSPTDNRGYTAGGSLTYLYSPRTQLTGSASYSHFQSDVSRSNYVTATVGVTHQFSERLTLFASVGHFWSHNEALTDATVCPTTPILCELGLATPIVIVSGGSGNVNGPLYNGNLNWQLTERTSFLATLAQQLGPTATGGATGVLTKTQTAGATLLHQFSERLTGRVGAGYIKTIYPPVQNVSISNTYYSGTAGVSYRLAERWTLDLGYTHSRTEYSQNDERPQSNTVFLTLGYGWPATTLEGGWFGTYPEFGGYPGSGGIFDSLPPQPIPRGAPGSTRSTPEAPSSPGENKNP
jgi:opacity protein-like surface antigen